ncbi:MAG: aminoacyl-tRNA hydrolase [Proteobacteria bacterium]|nr:aminoacyl-tRNA hydrolase [Pseudomonadota bacterium]
MFLLVGLGNPGTKYQYTKHNFGFLLIDRLVADHALSTQPNKFNSEVFSGVINGEKVIAIKPQTYMNLSGSSVLQMASFYKIPPEKIIVFHDEIDVKLGKIKAKIGGGNAGHNGLKSIDGMVGKNYVRIRLGVGRPENPEYEVSDYVLSKFSKDELRIVDDINQKVSQQLPAILNDQINESLTEFLNKMALNK